jgi:Domain of unknown function (DUF4145)
MMAVAAATDVRVRFRGMQPFPTQLWHDLQDVPAAQWVCGFCSSEVGSAKGYAATNIYDRGRTTFEVATIRICPACGYPTLFRGGAVIPGPLVGKSVEHVPEDVYPLYEEARLCLSHGASNACVLICRKILMHVGVEKGAGAGKSFAAYVNHLADGFLPPNAKDWVDHIRKAGNQATHELPDVSPEEAMKTLRFVEQLLRNVYELPALGKS